MWAHLRRLPIALTRRSGGRHKVDDEKRFSFEHCSESMYWLLLFLTSKLRVVQIADSPRLVRAPGPSSWSNQDPE